MLPGEDGRGAENGALFPVHNAFKGGPQSDFGFSKAHVSAQKPFHGGFLLHVRLDFLDTTELIFGFLILKMGFKIFLILGVGGKSVAFHLLPLGIEGDELVSHLVHRFADPLPGFLPLAAVEAVEFDSGVLPGADVFRDQIQLGDRYVKSVGSCVFYFNIIFDDTVEVKLMDAVKDADTVGHVYHIISHCQIGEGFNFLAFTLFRLPRGSGDRFSGGGEAELDLRVLKSGGEGPLQYKNAPVADVF